VFFAEPEQSIRGGEWAVDAQNRIVNAIRRHATEGAADTTTFVSHGGVGSGVVAREYGWFTRVEVGGGETGCKVDDDYRELVERGRG
jgi:broad specificity phosphatase PhoE